MFKSKIIKNLSLLVFSFTCLFILTEFNSGQKIKNSPADTALRTKFPTGDLIRMLENKIPALQKKAMIPGISIAVIKHGKPTWIKSYGVKSSDTKEPVTDNTIFEAASLSKPVFAYAVMKLVERGKLNLDTPLIKYISKEYLDKNFLGRKVDDQRIFKITARMCLSHTPGFPNWRRRGKLTIINEPGEKFSYSGEGFGYLQKVVEKITGLDLNEFMKKEVFNPLGMKHSSYVWQKNYDKLSSVPHGLMGKAAKKRKPKRGHAGASLHTTASDYAKYIQAIMNFEGLKEATVKSMLVPQVVVNQKETKNVTWGLGFGLEKTIHGTTIWHWGDNGNFKCFFMAYPKQKLGVCYFTNSSFGLSIRKQIVNLATGGDHPVLNSSTMLTNYGDVNEPGMEFLQILKEKGLQAALKRYDFLKKSRGRKDIVNERTMNIIGYYFLGKKDYKKAILIFNLNVKAFPKSFNAWDSLGEAHMKAGNKDLAIKYYEKSVKLNPNNEGGKRALKKLKQK